MTTKIPIPDAALDDRLAFVGTSGSGKTYNAGTAVERLLSLRARVGIIDPLGVWWGLRMQADGKTASRFKIVIFGGPHGDLPLTEHAGTLIGETCASMAESFILDLSGLGTKAAERRFTLHFLTALYRKTTGEPLNLVTDEADMFAPQMVSDRDGEAVKLLGMMETIVRRGRIKGFIPWLITQRPAVLNKNVLSQADGLIAMKLTSSQDRSALGDWIEGQADRAEGKRILAEMPALQLGQGVVWIPGRGILTTANFPRKQTFDSSRTPKRGEAKRTLTLKPLDLGALKARLATIETEVAANDPKALKARVAELERQLKAAPAGRIATIGEKKGAEAAFKAAQEAIQAARRGYAQSEAPIERPQPAANPVPATRTPAPARTTAALRPTPPAASGSLTGPQMAVLGALAWWRNMGHASPLKNQVAAIVGWSPKGSNLRCRISDLRVAGLIDGSGDRIGLTPAGIAAAPEPPAIASCLDGARAILSGPQLQVFNAIETGEPITRDDLAAAVGWDPTGSNLRCRLSDLRVLALIEGDASGFKLQGWVRE